MAARILSGAECLPYQLQGEGTGMLAAVARRWLRVQRAAIGVALQGCKSLVQVQRLGAANERVGRESVRPDDCHHRPFSVVVETLHCMHACMHAYMHCT